MVEIVIDASDLKGEGSELIKGLADFLKEKTNAEVVTETKEITVKGEGEAVSKKYLRVLLRKFLHQKELKKNYRVIGDKENILKIKERRIYEED